jgi:hypothetical protein
MVGRVRTLLGMIQRAVPQPSGNFRRHETTSGHIDSERLYEGLAPVDFSRDVLAESPADLGVLDAGSVGWTDLGEPERVVRLIAQLDSQCDWIARSIRSRSTGTPGATADDGPLAARGENGYFTLRW